MVEIQQNRIALSRLSPYVSLVIFFSLVPWSEGEDAVEDSDALEHDGITG